MQRLAQSVRRAFALLNPALRRRWLFLIPWALLLAALEMAAAAGILLLIRLISSPERPAIFGPFELTRGDGARFALALTALYVVKNLLRLMETHAQQRCATDTARWVSAGLLDRYLRAPYSLHLRRNSSEMAHIVGIAANQVGYDILQPAIALVSETMVVIGILAVLVLQLPGAALGVAVAVAGLMMMLLWMTQRRHTNFGAVEHYRSIDLLRSLRQSLAAVKEAKILGRERYFVNRFARLRAALGVVQARRLTLEVVPRLVVETAFVAALAVLIAVPSNAGLVPTLGVFAYGGLRLLPSLHLIVYRFNRIGSVEAGIDAVDADWLNLAPPQPDFAPNATPPFVEAIELEGVSFTYEGAEQPAVRGIDLRIRRGESIGIVGPTGAGKSTLVDLILGLLEPGAGRIAVDGRDIRSFLRGWQQQIGYVPQSVYLIDDAIRRNIALGIEDGEIDETRVIESARLAQLEEFLAALPQGLDTITGERGVKLSGGERQRIAIARAMYRRPTVLVFDEATAALDNVTERALSETVHALHGNVTMIFIAHRLSTVRACDRLVFLSEGRICGIGSYDELMNTNADFRRLALARAELGA